LKNGANDAIKHQATEKAAEIPPPFVQACPCSATSSAQTRNLGLEAAMQDEVQYWFPAKRYGWG
jgi:hypothetical protein